MALRQCQPTNNLVAHLRPKKQPSDVRPASSHAFFPFPWPIHAPNSGLSGASQPPVRFARYIPSSNYST